MPIGIVDGDCLLRAIERAGRLVDVSLLDGGYNFVDADLPASQQARVELDMRRILLRTVNTDLGDAVNHRDALRHGCLGVLVDIGEPQRWREERQVENRLIGWIHLLERRGIGQVVWQITLRLGDHRLHVLRGGVNVAREGELQSDVGYAKKAGRGHLVDACDGRELLLQGHRDRACHGFRAGARLSDGYQNGRKINVWKIADRQQAIARRSENQNRRHDQRCHDWPLDENLGYVHDCFPCPPSEPARGFSACLISTLEPGISLTWPSVTTVSPGVTPCSTMS